MAEAAPDDEITIDCVAFFFLMKKTPCEVARQDLVSLFHLLCTVHDSLTTLDRGIRNNKMQGIHFVSVRLGIEDVQNLTHPHKSCRSRSVKLPRPTPNANHRSD